MQTDTIKALRACVQQRQPVILWGAPGVGKTAYVQQLAVDLNAHLETVLASIREPSDFAGLPVLINEQVYLAPPSWATRLREAADDGQMAILFLDEASTAPPAVQSAMLRVVHEGVVGDIHLGNVAIVAAANPVSQAAGGWDLAPSSANRWVHLPWTADLVVWSAWFAGNGAGSPKVKGSISGFLRRRPELLLQVPDNETQASKGWPSPRSWEALSRTLSAVNGDSTVAHTLATGCVGPGAALEYLTYREEADLPDPEVLLANPANWSIPRRGDRVYATLTSVASAVINRPSRKRWDAAWLLLAAAEDDHADLAASAAGSLYARAAKEKLEGCDSFPDALLAFHPILEAAGLL